MQLIGKVWINRLFLCFLHYIFNRFKWFQFIVIIINNFSEFRFKQFIGFSNRIICRSDYFGREFVGICLLLQPQLLPFSHVLRFIFWQRIKLA